MPTLRILGIFTVIGFMGFGIFKISRKKIIHKDAQTAYQSKKVTNHKQKPQIWNQVCINCHSLRGEGGDIGPALDLVGEKFTREYLINWLKDPEKIKHGTIMPNFELSETEMNEIITFLSQLKKQSI